MTVIPMVNKIKIVGFAVFLHKIRKVNCNGIFVLVEETWLRNIKQF